MDRRRFLRTAGIASASALASCVFAPASASPSPTQEGTPAPSSPAATPTARAADWDSLGRALKGELIRPADPAYDAARILYNTRFDSIRPQGVARCAPVDAVRTCVAFAAQTGVPPALRRGGGGGSGVVPPLTCRTQPAGPLALGFQRWPWTAAAAVIAAWQGWQREAPATVWSHLHLDADPAGARLSLYAVGADGISSLRA